ncbi:MAG: helix-turn-helix transcriptional regulator [Desulfobacterales bacterium]|nr:helix-turn-helix transcriptional regulator [Desulfobacterales bacterium]
MRTLYSTREVAQRLGVNEKMVYSLIAEKGLPATKVTGKWRFPAHLVDEWIENHTINIPETEGRLPPYQGLLIIAGSNDYLLDQAISLFNVKNPGQVAVFGNLGSMGGIRALRQNLCHIASSHLLQENGSEYNFEFAARELDPMPAMVNFCRREQGLLLQPGNPKGITSAGDLARADIRIVNRPLGTGTRLLFDRELKKAGIQGEKIAGYDVEIARHMDVGLEVLAGRAHAGPAIRPVASLLGLDFLPIRWERYDLMIRKEKFFEPGVQRFLGLLHDPAFLKTAARLAGYDLRFSGKMVFPQDTQPNPKKEEAS